jgi:hypothetical protein
MICFPIIAGTDSCGKTSLIKHLETLGYRTTSWHRFAKEVFLKIPGFPVDPPDLGWEVYKYVDVDQRESYFKEIFSLWNLSIQAEMETYKKTLFGDSHCYRFLIKEQLLYGNFGNNELLSLLPQPELIFLIELNTKFSWQLNNQKPEFYEKYPGNDNEWNRFNLFQTDVYNGMKTLYSELQIPVVILPNTGLLSKADKHEMWMEIISQYI